MRQRKRRLPEITERLLKHVDPEMGMSIEMINT
jgi:hypothetical protein